MRTLIDELNGLYKATALWTIVAIGIGILASDRVEKYLAKKDETERAQIEAKSDRQRPPPYVAVDPSVPARPKGTQELVKPTVK
jgi:hypothetical protein